MSWCIFVTSIPPTTWGGAILRLFLLTDNGETYHGEIPPINGRDPPPSPSIIRNTGIMKPLPGI